MPALQEIPDQHSAIAASSLPCRGLPARHPLASLLGFALGVSVYLVPLLRLCRRQSDEGILVTGAVRTLHGQLLGRDFVEIMGPGSFYWIAAFLRLFGETFFAVRTCLFVTTLATVLALFFLSRRICGRWTLLPPLLVLASYFFTFWPEMSHHVDSNCFALLGVTCLVLWLDHPRHGWLIAAGCLVGATALTLQQKGAYLFVGAGLWLLLQSGPVRQRIGRLLLFCGGFLLPLLATAAYFARQGALGDLLYATVIWPRQNYGHGFHVHYAFLLSKYFSAWLAPGAWWTWGMAALLFLPYLFVAALPLVLPALLLVSRRRRLTPAVGLCWAAGLALWLAELHRQDIAHLVMGSPLLLLLAVYYLQHEHAPWRTVALRTLMTASASLLLVSEVIGLLAQPVHTRAGTTWFRTPAVTLTALAQRVPAGSDIFLYPMGLMDYFFLRTNNPTRYSNCTFNFRYAASTEQDEIIRDLDQKRVRYVVWDKKIDEALDDALFSDGSVPRLDLGPYLAAHYRPVWSEGKATLFERIDAPAR